METTPILDVLRCAKRGEFIVVNYAFSQYFGACVGSGTFIRLSAGEMRSRGLPLILDSLAGFAVRKEEPSDSQAWSPAERRRFDREHSHVNVEQISSELLRLRPMERLGGGWTGRKGQAMEVKLPTSPEEFYKSLMEAFTRSDD